MAPPPPPPLRESVKTAAMGSKGAADSEDIEGSESASSDDEYSSDAESVPVVAPFSSAVASSDDDDDGEEVEYESESEELVVPMPVKKGMATPASKLQADESEDIEQSESTSDAAFAPVPDAESSSDEEEEDGEEEEQQVMPLPPLKPSAPPPPVLGERKRLAPSALPSSSRPPLPKKQNVAAENPSLHPLGTADKPPPPPPVQVASNAKPNMAKSTPPATVAESSPKQFLFARLALEDLKRNQTPFYIEAIESSFNQMSYDDAKIIEDEYRKFHAVHDMKKIDLRKLFIKKLLNVHKNGRSSKRNK